MRQIRIAQYSSNLPVIGFAHAMVFQPLSFQVQGTNIRTSKVPRYFLSLSLEA
jgi:hypothetical protein